MLRFVSHSSPFSTRIDHALIERRQVGNPVAVLCFQAPGALGLGSRAPIEQLFNDKELIRVPVSRDLGETYGRLLIETIGRYGMPSSPPYSPSP